MKLREALENTKSISDKHAEILISIGLYDNGRNLTILSHRLLMREKSAADELNVNIRSQWQSPWPDWVTDLPPPRNYQVFGPGICCGDIAALSLDF